MRISEIFASIQGEGKLAGTPSVFVRTSFCNLRCRWCDTPYTSWSPEFSELSIERILQKVSELSREADIHHAVITGGEPFLQSHDLTALNTKLQHEGFHVTIETNGTIFYPVVADLFSVSPKLANSVPAPSVAVNGNSGPVHWHDRIRINLEALRMFVSHARGGSPGPSTPADLQFKFVVENRADLFEVDRIVEAVPLDKASIHLMPQATSREDIAPTYAFVREICGHTGYGFSPRLHIERFGNTRGT